MLITYISPHYEEWRGNKITVDRIKKGAADLGIRTSVISSTGPATEPEPGTALIHGFHAYKFAVYYENLAVKIPYIITLTGTDMNHDADLKDKQHVIAACLKQAAYIHCFDKFMKEKAEALVPDCKDKIRIIPQALEPLPFLFSPALSSRQDEAVLLLPAGIRKVKNIQRAVALTERLREKFPNIKLVTAGPVIEEEEGTWLREKAADADWLIYAGERPFHEMEHLYKKASIVLNTSRSEGQSSAVMEAMSAGKPVLASDIPGNRSLITHEETGCLFSTDDEFIHYVEKMLVQADYRNKISRQAAEYIRHAHNPAKEADALFKLYQTAVQT